MLDMLRFHRRVFFLEAQLGLPEGETCHQSMGKLERFLGLLRDRYAGCRELPLGCILLPEHGSGRHEDRCHFVAVFDARHEPSYSHHNRLVERLWLDALGVPPDVAVIDRYRNPPRHGWAHANGLPIDRDDQCWRDVALRCHDTANVTAGFSLNPRQGQTYPGFLSMRVGAPMPEAIG
jgi:hypothetical protein